MAMVSTSPMSPSSFLPKSENMPPNERRTRHSAPLPLQQTVRSASAIPVSPSRLALASHTTSLQYVEQSRTFVEHQRQLHNEERALWHLERQELHARVAELEAAVRQLQGRRATDPTSPAITPTFALGTFGAGNLPTHTSPRVAASTGDEFWRGAGGKRDSVPTRTFSESSENSSILEGRQLPSIAEDNAEKQSEQDRGPSIDGSTIDKNLDGIILRPKAILPSIAKSISPHTPSSLHSPSSGHTSPKHLDLPSTSNLKPEDLYTKDAGHTPLARDIVPDADNNSTAASSNQATPTIPEQGRMPAEPRPSVSFVRPPNERANSYFPSAPIVEESDGDTELKEPLALKNEGKDDNSFLNELDSKLLDVAKHSPQPPDGTDNPSGDNSTSGAGEDKAKDEIGANEKEDGDDAKSLDEGDSEPQLKIKRSMNFGSVFGARSCGKGI